MAQLQLHSVQLKHFRCFKQKELHFDRPLVVLEGENGSGKTTLLEALHYLCYLRSFRTHIPRHLIQFEREGFFIKAGFSQNTGQATVLHEIQAGFTPKRRLVKIDGKSVCSYKELMDYYRVITLTEEDLHIINGTPDVRRTFLDQALLLADPTFIEQIRSLRNTIAQRNAILQKGRFSRDSYDFWTKQLWQQSHVIQERRGSLLKQFDATMKELVADYIVTSEANGDDYPCAISCAYKTKKMALEQSFEAFINNNPTLAQDEQRWGRSLFGAHLDDFSLSFRYKKSKSFASRGQQKLIIVLLKIAQVNLLSRERGPVLFLLDDFMTDFDPDRAARLIAALQSLESQLIFTSPSSNAELSDQLDHMGAQRIKITD